MTMRVAMRTAPLSPLVYSRNFEHETIMIFTLYLILIFALCQQLNRRGAGACACVWRPTANTSPLTHTCTIVSRIYALLPVIIYSLLCKLMESLTTQLHYTP
jgi:hypothetical protein